MRRYDLVMDRIYLDNNSTTQPAPQVVEAVTRALRELWANASSAHRAGQEVRHAIELAREQVANLIGTRAGRIIFTSGATESNNLALRGILQARSPRKTIVTTTAEHSAIREPCAVLEARGYRIVRLDVNEQGVVDPARLTSTLDEYGDDVALVSIHWANNETGVIQPIKELAATCREHRVLLHTDATQAVGKIPVDVNSIEVDALSLSAHKFHGPKGVGALYVRTGVRMMPQIIGGPQERQRRGGTENTPGIVGMGAAADLANEWLAGDGATRQAALRDRLERSIVDAVDGAQVNASGATRLWTTTNIAFPPLEAEAILLLLSERGLDASAGAACSSGSLDPSPVLLAMGLPEPVAHGSVRFSLSRDTRPDEIDRAIDTIPAVIARLKQSMPVG